MIGHYLSSNNEMCYSTKINNFSPTKQGLIGFVLYITYLQCFEKWDLFMSKIAHLPASNGFKWHKMGTRECESSAREGQAHLGPRKLREILNKIYVQVPHL